LGNEKAIIEDLAPPAEKDSIPEKEKKTISTKKIWPSLKEVNRGAIEKAESEIILKTLEMTNWNRKKAAHILNVSYKALLNKIKKTGLEKRVISSHHNS
jgi:DNA-binding NtrC family response regulator